MLALLPLLATVHYNVGPTSIDAIVEDAELVEPLFLVDIDDRSRPLIQARSVTPLLDDAKPVALAIVIQTNEIMMGADMIEDNEYDPDRHELYKPLRAALDHIGLGTRLPPGSSVTLIGYDNTVHDLAPWKDAAKVTGADLGSLRDYHGKIGSELAEAVTYAGTQLTLAGDMRRPLLLIIGDGNDTNNEQARAVLRPVKKWNIPTFAIIVKTAVSSEGDVLQGVAHQRRVSSVDGIEAGLVAALDSLHQPFKATFDIRVPQDGKFHTFAVATRDAEIARDTVHMPGDPNQHTLWWYAMIAAIVVGAGVVIVKVRGRR